MGNHVMNQREFLRKYNDEHREKFNKELFERNDDKFIEYLENANIETRPMLPLLNQPIYKELFGDIEKEYPVAEYIDHNGFYVGCHHGMTKENLDNMVMVFDDFLKNYL